MLWHYQTEEDMEDMGKASRQISADGRTKYQGRWAHSHSRRKPEAIHRRDCDTQESQAVILQRSHSLHPRTLIWSPRDDLVKRGSTARREHFTPRSRQLRVSKRVNGVFQR
jgi:elongation factor 3